MRIRSFLLAIALAACGSEASLAEPGDGAADGGGGDAVVEVGGEVGVDAAVDAIRVDAADADPKPTCKLVDSPPVVAKSDGQVIENLKIVAKGTPGIQVAGKKNVVIRNVLVLHEGAPGISLANADGARIENVAVEHTGAPPSGKADSADRNDIDAYATAKLVVSGARLTRGSSGIYLNACPSAKLTQIEGYDFRGPFPRGQLVQFNASNDGLLDGFSVVNGHTSWTEDNVNVYKSTNVVIRNGLVDGNNSPSGVGVIFDGDTGAGLVEDVDAVHMGNGCFSNYAGADGNTFRRVRCRDNICTSQDGRGAPSSNALMFAGKPTGTANTSLEQAKYFASCNGNLTWPAASFAKLELVKEDFALRAKIKVPLCWE